MNVNQTVLVIGMFPYKFEDEKSGKMIEGCTVHYVDTNEVQERGNGLKPNKARISLEEFQKVQTQILPAFAQMNAILRLSTNKLEIQNFSDFEIVSL